MSVADVYGLPVSILQAVHQMIEFDDVRPVEIMNMVKERYIGEVNFSLHDIKEYMRIIKEKANSEVPMPLTPMVINTSTAQVKQMDRSPLADYRNSREIIDMFKKDIVNGFSNLRRMKDDAYARDQILTDLEAIMLQYVKQGMDLMDKEGRIKTEMQESNQNIEYVREEIKKILIVVRSVLKGQLNEHKFREVMQALASALELYKFKI